MRTHLLAASLVILSLGVGQARAGSDPVCLATARSTYAACKADCKEAYLTDKDLCRNVDPACATACRAGRAVCVEPFETVLQGCLDGCAATLDAEKALCAPDDDACIDAAQVRAFVCRDTCRENQTVRDGIAACRAAARACIKACPPPPAP